MGDFTGFQFGDWSSSIDEVVTILRVSDGDRYNEDLQSEIKDRTAEVPGLDGEYYFGSNYGPKTIEVSIAFDSLTESQFRELRKVFGTSRQVQELIFDERPYKKYLAKISSPIELSYVCFDEPIKEEVSFNGINGTTKVMRLTEGKQRIYKGEGKISFICYFPFAKSVYKKLPSESNDWAFSSGILSVESYESNHIDEFRKEDGEDRCIINIYNAGDISTGFRLYLPSTALSNDISIAYKKNNEEAVASLNLKPITLEANDIGVLIDTNNSLIVGVSEIEESPTEITASGNLYNSYIDSGYFFKLEPNVNVGESAIYLTGIDEQENVSIYYDYLYF